MQYIYTTPVYQINTQIYPQINTQINHQIIAQRNAQIIAQRNAQIIAQRNAQMVMKTNYDYNMNKQNNFFNKNIANQMGNLQIVNNKVYYNNNENIAMNKNQLEQKKKSYFFDVIFKIIGVGCSIIIETFPGEKGMELIEKYRKASGDYELNNKFLFGGNNININFTCSQLGLKNYSTISVLRQNCVRGAGYWYIKEINIKFIKVSKKIINKNDNKEITGLLKLCLLKEISQKISGDKLKSLPDLVYYILRILSNGYIQDNPYDIKKNVKEVLEKSKGSNIITFSNYVDEIIDSQLMNKILNLLDKKNSIEMINLKNILSNYNNCIKFFNKEFIRSLKESIFEFSIISLVIIERENFKRFEEERLNCPNRVEKILYHGTSIKNTSNILKDVYLKSKLENAINGIGVYFTDLLDYAWYYGSEKGKRYNFLGIPKIDDTFTVIMNYIYYDRNGLKKVNDNKREPGKYQINYAYSDSGSCRIDKYDKSKFYAVEYVINDLDQICPFMSAKLKRVEYCVIWRDNNFSSKPVFNNKYDKIFKSFLKERLKYINQNAKYNIYPCEKSEEALALVKRKKFNKIILISNVGENFGGKLFIDEARKIIGNNVIALFLAYDDSHLNWIKNYENALFSNEPKFYEEYLQCFDGNGEIEIKNNIKNLINKLEAHYKVKFNFNDKYLDYPQFIKEGKYGDLKF